MAFDYPASVDLARRPTPIEPLARISTSLEGPGLFIKRDDFTGVGITGNKVRKLDFLLAEALEQKCDTVITCGGYQSNHARTTAVMCAKLGLKCHLVLRNGISASLDGNLFLDRLVGAEIHYVNPDEYMAVDDVMRRLANQLKADGSCAYVIPEGGSNALGAVGYVRAAEEIAAQCRERKLKLHHIVVAVGSGGTYAGLLLGKYLYDLPATIHGINVSDNESYFVNKIHKILQEMERRFELGVKLGKKDIHIVDGYVGKGYGLSRQEELDVIKLVAREEGIILDPVYTGKCFFGMMNMIKEGKFRQDENVLFVHTGGIFGLFPKKTLFF